MTAVTEIGFADGLAAHGDRLALLPGHGRPISYRELDQRVAGAAERLGSTRRLVLLAARNDVESIVAYLAALRGRHPVLLAARGQIDALAAAYDPDLVIDAGWHERRPGSAHRLHPELVLLLSTSGSTGSPKLVRLSLDNLRSNAAAIAEYLDIRSTDRAITSLPPHYCYGLSVINSNLLRGAGLVLSDHSVSDPAFWTAVHEHGVTSLHGVPHTFELLDQVGLAHMALPSLRYVTQAGGRLDPAAVARFAALGEERGWRFFVMYGQTEATARMAYLPPELAREHPTAIGIPIPGGEFTIVDGELVYRGPNVMLGYAHDPADLALGRTVGELRTGDLAQRTPEGLYQLAGRAARFRKLFGLRVDLDRVERLLADAGIEAACSGTDEAVVVAVRAEPQRAADLVRARLGLPAGSVRGYRVDTFPRLPTGKIDYPAVERLAPAAAGPPGRSVRHVYAAVLGHQDVPDDASFIDLGGDSLTYVRASLALELLLGHLPADWPSMTVAELERRRRRPSRVPMVETSIVLRAVAITLLVGTHVKLFTLLGGAHLLLILAGWTWARFVLPVSADRAAPDRAGPATRTLRSAALVAVPSIGWLSYRAAVTEDVTIANVLLVSTVLRTGAEAYWFVEVIVHILLGVALLCAVPVLRRAERAHPFGFALAVLGVAVLVHASLGDAPWLVRNMTAAGAAWFFVLGWLAQRADSPWRKVWVIALAAVLVPGTFGEPAREFLVLAGLALLVVLAKAPVPKFAVRGVSLVASASLAIYLTHGVTYPVLLEHLPPVPVAVLAIAIGVLAWWSADALARVARRSFARS